MYKMSLLLKLIIIILTITIVVISNNRIILWLILFVLSLFHLKMSKKIIILLDLILVLLLGLSVNEEVCLLIFKIIFIIDCFITIVLRLSNEDKKVLFRKKTTSKLMYYEDKFDKIVSRINEKKNKIYDEDVSIDKKIEEDLDRNYLQAKIRYMKSSKIKKRYFTWNRIDTLILLLAITVFMILFILR